MYKVVALGPLREEYVDEWVAAYLNHALSFTDPQPENWIQQQHLLWNLVGNIWKYLPKPFNIVAAICFEPISNCVLANFGIAVHAAQEKNALTEDVS